MCEGMTKRVELNVNGHTLIAAESEEPMPVVDLISALVNNLYLTLGLAEKAADEMAEEGEDDPV